MGGTTSGATVYWVGFVGYRGNDRAAAVTVGDYTFRSVATESPYAIGVYAVWKNTLYTLEDAYASGLVADSDLPAIYEEHKAFKPEAYEGFDD